MIVNCFNYNAPFEADLLEIKFNAENKGIDKWVIIENNKDYHGVGKLPGYTLKRLLNQKRFDIFKEKVEVIQISYGDQEIGNTIEDYSILLYQRNLQRQWIYDNCQSDDWAIISDIDCIVDFDSYYNNIINSLQDNIVNRFDTLWFAFDFDNIVPQVWDRPGIIQRKVIEKYQNIELPLLFNIRSELNNWDTPVNIIKNSSYHYWNCFDKESLQKKFDSNVCTGWTDKLLNKWLRCNIIHGNDPKYPLFKGSLFKCEMVELNETNSPLFVRNNLKKLKTNLINPLYKLEQERL